MTCLEFDTNFRFGNEPAYIIQLNGVYN